MIEALIKAAWLLYAGIHGLLAVRLYRDNVHLAYPTWVTFSSAAAQTLIACGILLYVFYPQKEIFSPVWRWVFPLLILELLAGVARDAIGPNDFSFHTHGAIWLVNLAFNLILFSPAYYANFMLAQYGSR
jgi:hypothetical protein